VAYTYKVSPGVVKDATGKTVYTGTHTAAIQWAIDKTASGGTVLLDKGTFSITGKIWVTRNLVGSGSTLTKLVAANSLGTDTMIEIANRNFAAITKITVSDFEIDRRGTTYTCAVYGGLELVQATNCLVQNMYIHDFPKSHGIEFQASSYNNIKNCVVKNIGYGGQYGNGICGGNQIAGKSTSFNTVDGCTISGCSMVGVNWEPGNDNTVKNTAISGLKTWSGGPTVGISIWNKGGYAGSNNNKFINVQVTAATTNVISTSTTGQVFDGCTFTGAKSPALYTNLCSGWMIKNCKFMTAGGHAVYTYNSNKMTVTGCYMEDTSGAKTGRGVWMANDASHTSTGNVISNNQMVKCQYAVYLGTKTYATVTGNTEISCRSADYITTSGNTISGNIRK
jgi:parallel beta-helix repeat protein